MNLGTTPGHLTDKQDPRPMDWVRAHGYDWISFQAYNPRDGGLKDRDLGPAKAAGLEAGIWVVSYGRDDQPDDEVFRHDGAESGRQAMRLGAQHLIADIEMAAKGTRATRGLIPFVEGCRLGGWKGPVDFTTLGAPVNAIPHGGNDFGIDVQSFLDTGGSILPQAYFNAFDEYRPKLCWDYWRACGVPADRLNLLIELGAEAGRPRMSGADWLPYLREADVRRNFSVYMTEFLEPFDLEALQEFSLSTKPPHTGAVIPPVAIPSASSLNKQIDELAESWLKNFTAEQTSRSRLRAIQRIARSTDAEWLAERGDVYAALDGDTLEDEIKVLTERAFALESEISVLNGKIAHALEALEG